MPTNNNIFRISLPEGWRETTVYPFEGPHDSGVQHNLLLVVNPEIEKEMTLSRYAKLQVEDLARTLPAFELISEKQGILPSGVPVAMVVYRYSPSDDLTLFQKQYHIIAGGKGYSFTSTFSKKTLKTIANDVDQIVASLKFISQQA